MRKPVTPGSANKPATKTKAAPKAHALPCPEPGSDVSVRKIENGFIVRKEGTEKNNYRGTETFHPKNPLRGK